MSVNAKKFLASQKDPTLRGHYIDVDYVRRVQQALQLGDFDRRIADHDSVHGLVEQFQKEYDYILFYRPKTMTSTFCLVIQTASMAKAMAQFGKTVLCCDTSHEITRYVNLLLGTLMTVGAAEEGQPVLIFLVESESEIELVPVFQALAKK